MQINRLFEIVYCLLNKKTITARELSERFEVSIRTIYRDVDTLSAAGIPIYTNKGKGGGICLMEDFVLNKSVLSESEQNEILMSLQGLNAVKVPDLEPVLHKLSALFNKQGMNWIDVDFSRWGSGEIEREKFQIIKSAILNKTLVSFDYYSSYGEKTQRTVEPLKLLFKGQDWYIYGFCRVKSDYRMFKLNRIKELCSLTEIFQRDTPKDIWVKNDVKQKNMITLVIRIAARMAYRIYDEFNQECICKNEDGSFTITALFPEDEWVYGYVLSFGNDAELIEPEYFREKIKENLKKSLNKYL